MTKKERFTTYESICKLANALDKDHRDLRMFVSLMAVLNKKGVFEADWFDYPVGTMSAKAINIFLKKFEEWGIELPFHIEFTDDDGPGFIRVQLIKAEANKEVGVAVDSVIDYLNKVTAQEYRKSAKKTRAMIESLFQQKYALEDIYAVIDKKALEWMGTPSEKYLRPETLFGSKFESYRNQKSVVSAGQRMRTSYNVVTSIVGNHDWNTQNPKN